MAPILFALLVLLTTFHMTTGFQKSLIKSTRLNIKSDPLPTVVLYDSSAGDTGIVSSLLGFARKFTASTLYAGIETFIVIGLLAAIDGGFSGDWSKFGYVTTDVEEKIRSAVTSVGLFHLVCAPVAAISTSKQGQPVVPAVLHTLAIGGLGLFRVLMQTEDTLVQFPSFGKKDE